MGKVYFFTDGVHIKIGFTTQAIKKRIQQLNTGSSFQIYSLGYMSGSPMDEKHLHQKFAKQRMRVNGEWFFPSQELIDYINDVNEEKNVYIEYDQTTNKVERYFSLKII